MSVYCYLALYIWFVAAGVSFGAFLVEMLFTKRFLARYADWLCILFTPLFLPTRVYIAWLEGKHAATARARRARYIWASSFWDEDKTKKALSRSHWTISRNLFLWDMMLATFFTSVVVFARRFGPDLQHRAVALHSRGFRSRILPSMLVSYLRTSAVVFQYAGNA